MTITVSSTRVAHATHRQCELGWHRPDGRAVRTTRQTVEKRNGVCHRSITGSGGARCTWESPARQTAGSLRARHMHSTTAWSTAAPLKGARRTVTLCAIDSAAACAVCARAGWHMVSALTLKFDEASALPIFVFKLSRRDVVVQLDDELLREPPVFGCCAARPSRRAKLSACMTARHRLRANHSRCVRAITCSGQARTGQRYGDALSP